MSRHEVSVDRRVLATGLFTLQRLCWLASSRASRLEHSGQGALDIFEWHHARYVVVRQGKADREGGDEDVGGREQGRGA